MAEESVLDMLKLCFEGACCYAEHGAWDKEPEEWVNQQNDALWELETIIENFNSNTLVGKRFGMLTVTCRGWTEELGLYWECRCDCGGEIAMKDAVLRNGTTVGHCGCQRGKRVDLTGRRFGKLVVQQKAEKSSEKHGRRWVCLCDCGMQITVRGDLLKLGKRKSCGCLREGKKLDDIGNPTSTVGAVKVGKVYGRLTVADRKSNQTVCASSTMWVCQCKCGKVCEVRADRLAYGNTKSCGCLAVDASERQIRRYQARLNKAAERQKALEQRQDELKRFI